MRPSSAFFLTSGSPDALKTRRLSPTSLSIISSWHFEPEYLTLFASVAYMSGEPDLSPLSMGSIISYGYTAKSLPSDSATVERISSSWCWLWFISSSISLSRYALKHWLSWMMISRIVFKNKYFWESLDWSTRVNTLLRKKFGLPMATFPRQIEAAILTLSSLDWKRPCTVGMIFASFERSTSLPYSPRQSAPTI